MDHLFYFSTICYEGDLEAVIRFISKESNISGRYINEPGIWNIGLTNACQGGNKEIVELMISRGAKDWDSAFHKALIVNNKEMMWFMILKEADRWWADCYISDFQAEILYKMNRKLPRFYDHVVNKRNNQENIVRKIMSDFLIQDIVSIINEY